MNRKHLWLDSVLVLTLAAILVAPLFRLEYMQNWGSIESTFISDARMLSENLPHPGWQPHWYTGTRFDYIYPPALRYGTALISKAGGISTARAYHLYVGLFYVGGILAVFWLMLLGSGSRWGAWLAAVATGLLSPCFLFLQQLRWDSGFGAPQRLHVLMQYGEGPHISALCVLPAALAAIWIALRDRKPGPLALASLLCALVVSNNFYGATALALLVPLLVWSVWLGERTWMIPARAVALAVLAYGMCAFWLTPGYLGITLANLRLVAEPGDQRSVVIFVVALLLFGIVSFVLGNRRPERAWPLFCAGAVSILSLYVLGHSYFGLQVAGNTLRLAPELDLAIVLAFSTAVTAACARPRWRIGVAVVVLVAFFPAKKYLKQPWKPFPKETNVEKAYPRQIARWAEANLTGARVLPAGEVRFWFNTWANIAQTDGGSQQGMLNQLLPTAFWQILTGEGQEPAVLWLQALGTDAVIVPDGKSRDSYRGDFKFPGKFKGLPPLFDDGQGTVIYKIPRTYPGIGRIVDATVLDATGVIGGGLDTTRLRKLVDETEKPGRSPVSVTWSNFDTVRLQAATGQGESILLQETWDPAWLAEENGVRLPLRRDPVMGFMLLSPPPGQHSIQLRFETPGENRVGQLLSLLSFLAAAWLGWKAWTGKRLRQGV